MLEINIVFLLKKRNKIAINKSTKLTIFFENLVSKQESNNNKNKDNIFFKNKFNKEATKKKTKNKKLENNIKYNKI